MGIKFLGTVEIKENMTTEELDRKISLEDYKKAKTYLDWYLGECESND